MNANADTIKRYATSSVILVTWVVAAIIAVRGGFYTLAAIHESHNGGYGYMPPEMFNFGIVRLVAGALVLALTGAYGRKIRIFVTRTVGVLLMGFGMFLIIFLTPMIFDDDPSFVGVVVVIGVALCVVGVIALALAGAFGDKLTILAARIIGVIVMALGIFLIVFLAPVMSDDYWFFISASAVTGITLCVVGAIAVALTIKRGRDILLEGKILSTCLSSATLCLFAYSLFVMIAVTVSGFCRPRDVSPRKAVPMDVTFSGKFSDRKIFTEEDAILALEDVKARFQMNNPPEEFTRVRDIFYGREFCEFQQTHKGAEVYNCFVRVLVSAAGDAEGLRGNYLSGLSLDVRPRMPGIAAKFIARQLYFVSWIEAPKLSIYQADNSEPRLCWKMNIINIFVNEQGFIKNIMASDARGFGFELRHVFIDARTGEVVKDSWMDRARWH